MSQPVLVCGMSLIIFLVRDCPQKQTVSVFGLVCSQHSASQDTLRDCTKCRGILNMRALRALSRTESDEASSRSCCAQLTI